MKKYYLTQNLGRMFVLALMSFTFSVTVYGQQIADELTCYWNFDGNLQDRASLIPGNDNTTNDTLIFLGSGSQIGSAFLGSGGYFGNGNGFAGVGDRADVDEGNGMISISLWARAESLDVNWQTIISKGELGNYRIARRMATDFVAFAGGNSDVLGNQVSLNDGQWHHIAATAGPSGSHLYVDGVLRGSNNSAANLTNSGNPLLIGENPQALGRAWNGGIDDIVLWQRELSATEVSLIYDAGINGSSFEALAAALSGGDLDNDGLPDSWEFTFGLSTALGNGSQGDDGANGDPDGDLLTNIEEFNNGTSPILRDTDGDGLLDGAELTTYNTDPTLVDSDGDGSPDGEEVFFGIPADDGALFPTAVQTTSGIQTAGSIGPYLDGGLPDGAPTPAQNISENWNVENAFPALNFEQLKGIVSEPRSNNLHVIERRGSIQMVDVTNPTTQQEVFDISSNVVFGDNGGLRSVVFHPEFNLNGSPNRNYMYCFYTTTADASRGFTFSDGSFFLRLSRFTRDEVSGEFPESSELVLIQQRSQDVAQHFAGSLGFDLDGFLLIGWGDMEFRANNIDGDFYQDVQRVDRIFQGAILRIDVDKQGGIISHAPTRTLQGEFGSNGVAGTTQSCPVSHPYFHNDNFSGRDYYIPSDNYFVLNPPVAGITFLNTPLHGPALEEHQALGFRNPWRMAVDPVDGDVAFFSVGSNSGDNFEEVELYTPGGNGGWPYLEGETSQTSETGLTEPPSLYAPTFLGVENPPLAYWPANVGRAASGGLFYRGNQWSSLDSQLIFADQTNGKIWALDYKSSGAPAANFVATDGVRVPSNYSVRLLIDSQVGVRQMAAGPNGQEIYVAGGNTVFRLFDSFDVNPEAPLLLSQTGAFTDLTNLTPRDGLIPYEPASELWSDRAAKKRWIAVPNQEGIDGEYDEPSEKITYSEDGEWAYPIGTVFIKHFALPTDLRDINNEALLKPIETRFLVRGEDGEYFYFTYRWRDDGSDADLLFEESTLDIPVIDEDGSLTNQTWLYPSRANCVDCHQSNAGHVLGMKSRQLNHPLLYPSTGLSANQLTTFSSIGLFDQSPDFGQIGTALRSVNINDTSASLEQRVRSYLDSNCSYCHRPGSEAGRSDFDVLLTTPLNLTGIINGTLGAGDLGVAGAEIVKPGAPEESVLYLRDSTTDENVMPPLARSLNDPDYVPVLRAWIETLNAAEFNQWASGLGIVGGLSGDDDHDGILNVFEFVLGQQAGGVNPGDLPNFTFNIGMDRDVVIPISSGSVIDGFQIEVEGSSDLENWFFLGDSGSELTELSNTSSETNDGALTIRVNEGVEKHFIRYRLVFP